MKRWMTTTLTLALLTLAMLCAALPAAAQETAPTGHVAAFLGDFDRVSKKLNDLAEAMPADKFGWRPVAGVRTVSEVYIHVVLANYHLAHFLGIEMPAGVSEDMEATVTAKADVLKALKDSQDFVRAAASKLSESVLEEQIDLFGSKRPRRSVLMILSGHSHEHLGQSIAYARMAGVTPPWSQPSGN